MRSGFLSCPRRNPVGTAAVAAQSFRHSAKTNGGLNRPQPCQPRSALMSVAPSWTDPATGLIALMDAARDVADALLGDAVIAVRERVSAGGRPDARLMEREQRATHGLAWFATYAQAIR